MHQKLPTTVLLLDQSIIRNTFIACRCMLLIVHTAKRWLGAEQYFILFFGAKNEKYIDFGFKSCSGGGVTQKKYCLCCKEGIYDE